MAELVQIPKENIAEFWPIAGPMLQKVIDRGCYTTVAKIRERVADGRQQIWCVWSGKPDAVVVTELAQTTAGLVGNIVSLGGANMSEWLHLIDDLEAWAREQGCVAMEITGRKGWARALPEYDVTQFVLSKRLT